MRLMDGEADELVAIERAHEATTALEQRPPGADLLLDRVLARASGSPAGSLHVDFDQLQAATTHPVLVRDVFGSIDLGDAVEFGGFHLSNRRHWSGQVVVGQRLYHSASIEESRSYLDSNAGTKEELGCVPAGGRFELSPVGVCGVHSFDALTSDPFCTNLLERVTDLETTMTCTHVYPEQSVRCQAPAGRF
jgi:hypothetical protein